MAFIFAVTNQKGGVGKTTTTVNLGVSLARLGKRVLLVDIDPQGNTTSGMGIEKSQLKCCIYDVLVNDKPVGEALQSTKVEHLKILPATLRLAGAEIELVSAMAREQRLALALRQIQDDFDYILLDCPPSLGLLTINALTASQKIIVPIQCEFYALEGLTQLVNVIDMVRSHLNPQLAIFGVLLTMFTSRQNLSTQVADEVRRYFGDKVFASYIPRNVKLAEAPSYGKSVLEYDLNSKGSRAYMDLAQEVIERG